MKWKNFCAACLGAAMLASVALLGGCASEGAAGRVLWDLELVTPPDKTEYVAGERFDATGMEIAAVYMDEATGAETREDVTEDVTIPTEPLELGQTSVSIVYAENGVRKTEAVSVTVRAPAEAPDDHGTLTVEDAYLYNAFPSSRLMAVFSNAAYAEAITYTYDSSDILIADGVVRAIGTIVAQKEITVTATTQYHTAEFRVFLAPTFAEHDATVPVRESALESRMSRGLYVQGGDVFAGDSFFDTGFWSDFYTDYEGRNAATVGIGGTRADEWTVYAERLIYPFAPETVVLNVGTNDIGRGESADTVAEELRALFERLHYNLPDAQICWYTITPRMENGAALYPEEIRAVNAAIIAWAQGKEWFTLLDAYTACCDASGDPVWENFRDGLHPILDNYNTIYMALLEQAGIEIAVLSSLS